MVVDNKDILVRGRFPKIALLKAEHYEWVKDPFHFMAELKSLDAGADLFTFIQSITDRVPRFDFYYEWDSIAVLPITTYDNWWKKQINDKTRNMVRRAAKSGVDVRITGFTDDLVRGIKGIYDETHLRQGRPFRHYGKSLETLREEHITFLDRSQFIGAFYGDELIGFVKMVHDGHVAHLMQILSKLAHRDKAPTNALIAKAVELCAEQGISHLHYSEWDRRGIGDFKRHHAFEQLDLPRYFVPLNLRGKLLLSLKLHRKMTDILPQRLVDLLIEGRNRWNGMKQNARSA